MKKRKLKLEINQKLVRSNDTFKVGGGTIMMTPSIDEDYWTVRVPLTKTQAIVGFPKFFTIGIGFAQEVDWNTNLPYQSEAEEIYNHIEHNKKFKTISKEDCIKAIKMIQVAVEVLGVEYFSGEANPEAETLEEALARVKKIAEGK